MRLWSISPSYLDRQGLCGLWLEALLCQFVLIKGEFSKCPICKGSCINKDNGQFPLRCKKCNINGQIKTHYYSHP